MEHVLHLTLQQHELLVLQLLRPGQVRAISGAHWLTINGEDICLRAGEQAQLPAGKLLLEGNGRLDLQDLAALAPQGGALQLGLISVRNEQQEVSCN
ncbi:DUF2917 domain-containing protein [Vogesella oryzae]|uniref:DUF2917 domain-containing protein n=1 Tax=Vogesella oryzae TaxID=1735285 RepID=UPI0015826A7D|nr:DUF2917 domain-containing protein [Vogesella oryzae]